MTDDEIIKHQAKQIAQLSDNMQAYIDMHWTATEYHKQFMEQEGKTWVWIFKHQPALEMMHYLAKTAKEMGCDIPRRGENDNLWWKPLQDAD